MTKERAELLTLITQLSDVVPDQRLGQLFANLATLARGAVEGAVWDCEDDEFISAARRMLATRAHREAESVTKVVA